MDAKTTLAASVQAKKGRLYAVIQVKENGKTKPVWRALGLPEGTNKSKVNKAYREVVKAFENDYAEQIARNAKPASDIPIFDYMCAHYKKIEKNIQKSTAESYHGMIYGRIRRYFTAHSMPEAVQSFAESKDFNEVRAIQKRILAAYEQDFSKHAPNEIVPKIRMLWNSIPSQLARENKKFIYGLVREGGRAREYETAIMWLSDCGLVHKVSRVNAAGIPLKAYEDLKAFKLFIVDVGLLGCMTGLRQRTLLDGDNLFVEFKGALTEQYVCQQLKTIEDLGVYYYTNDRGSCEIDFVVDTGEQIVPIEVKAETNLRAKSLKTYRERFEPELSVRTSMADYKKEDWLLNLPLYAIENITVESK